MPDIRALLRDAASTADAQFDEQRLHRRLRRVHRRRQGVAGLGAVAAVGVVTFAVTVVPDVNAKGDSVLLTGDGPSPASRPLARTSENGESVPDCRAASPTPMGVRVEGPGATVADIQDAAAPAETRHRRVDLMGHATPAAIPINGCALITVTNPFSTGLEAGTRYEIERFDDGQWMTTTWPYRTLWTLQAVFVESGEELAWITRPDGRAPGRYRAVTEASLTDAEGNTKETITIAAEFEITDESVPPAYPRGVPNELGEPHR